MANSVSSIKSADRVLDVLELICRRGNAVSHTQIASSLDIPKSSLTGLLKNLTSRQYLSKNPTENTYSLGSAFFELLKMGKTAVDIVQIAQIQLIWLTEKTKEASAFYLYKEPFVERELGIEANYPLSYRVSSKIKFPLYSAAAGKAVLNALPEKILNNYLQNTKFSKITANTATTPTEIKKRIKADTTNGVTISRNENTEGVIAFAVPILGNDQFPIGALSIVVPSVRLNSQLEELCRTSLITAQEKIKSELFY